MSSGTIRCRCPIRVSCRVLHTTCHGVYCLQQPITLFQHTSSMEFEQKRFIITFVQASCAALQRVALRCIVTFAQAPKTQTDTTEVARMVLDLSHFASVPPRGQPAASHLSRVLSAAAAAIYPPVHPSAPTVASSDRCVSAAVQRVRCCGEPCRPAMLRMLRGACCCGGGCCCRCCCC